MLNGLFEEEQQEPKKVTIHYNDGTKETVTVTAFQYCKKAKCDFIAFDNSDGELCIARIKNTDKDFLMSDDFSDEQFEMFKKQLFKGKEKNYNFSLIPSVLKEEVLEEENEEVHEEEPTAEELKENNDNVLLEVGDDDIVEIPIYVDEEGNYYEDKWGIIPYTKEEVEAMREDSSYTLIEKEVRPSIFNYKRKKVIYVDEEGYYFKDKYGKKPLSEEELEKFENDKHIELLEQPTKTRKPLFRNRVDIYIVGENYYLEKECVRPLKKEVVEKLYKNPKNKIVEHKKEEIIIYVDRENAKCYLDPNGIRKISRDKLDDYELSSDYIVRYQTLEKKKLKKRITVYVDQRGTIYAEPEAKRVINKEKLEELKKSEDIVVIEEQIRVNKKTPLTIYVDEAGKTYIDKEGKILIEPEKLSLLEENEDIILNRVPIKKVIKKVNTSPKIIEVHTEEKEKEQPIEMPSKKEEIRERIIYESNGKFFWDKLATMPMTDEEYQALTTSPKYKVVIEKSSKKIVLVFKSNDKYYYDSLGVNEIPFEKIEELKSMPQVDLVINEIEKQKVTIYKSGEDYFHDEYKLTPYTKEEIITLSQNPLYQMNIVEIKEKKQISEMSAEEIRNRMAQILNVENTDNIENANEHEISYQLDDWEIDEFQELRDALRTKRR